MFQRRVKNLQQKLKELKIDAFLASNFYNIFYLTGFKTLTENEREAWVLVTKDKVYLLSDGRYLTKNFIRQIGGSNFKLKLIEPGKGVFFHLKKIIEDEHIESLAVEAEDLRMGEYQKLKISFPSIKINPTEKLIIKLREIKDEEEIEKIKKACEIGDQCLRELVKTIKIGTTEKELSFRIEMWLKEKGYDLAFYPIVAVDKNSSIPHYATYDGNGKVKENSIILIDFGAKYQDYNSDITRMVFINPTQEMLNIYNVLLLTQEKTIKKISKDIGTKTIDSFCRNLITNYQLPNYPHSTGHGTGLEIHEYPKISQTSTDIIKTNQVFTIEPGVYFEGKWGIRIEDTVYIGDNHRPEVLTKFSKKPTILKIS